MISSYLFPCFSYSAGFPSLPYGFLLHFINVLSPWVLKKVPNMYILNYFFKVLFLSLGLKLDVTSPRLPLLFIFLQKSSLLSLFLFYFSIYLLLVFANTLAVYIALGLWSRFTLVMAKSTSQTSGLNGWLVQGILSQFSLTATVYLVSL